MPTANYGRMDGLYAGSTRMGSSTTAEHIRHPHHSRSVSAHSHNFEPHLHDKTPPNQQAIPVARRRRSKRNTRGVEVEPPATLTSVPMAIWVSSSLLTNCAA